MTSRALRVLDDEAFRNIALGQNYFELMDLPYEAPQLCSLETPRPTQLRWCMSRSRLRSRAHASRIGLLMPAIALAQADQPEEREEDDEPNQHAILEPLGTESEEERSRWLLEGAELVLKPRTYYLHRDYDTANTRAGWALGGGLEFRSGWWQDRVRFGATVSTSQKLYGPSDKDGIQLFKPGPEDGPESRAGRFAHGQAHCASMR